MSRNIMEIVFRIAREGTGDRETKQKLKDLESQFKKTAAVVGAFAGTAMAVGTAMAKSYQFYQQYAGAVRDLAVASGTSAEESSRLLQVMDDYQITAEQVTAATKFLTKQGLTPTLETLAQLSDQYIAIQDPMKRNEFAYKMLGKSAMDYINVLRQGGDALRAAGEDVDKFLVLSDEQIKKAEEQRLAMDALADSWDGLKVAVGSSVGDMILQQRNIAGAHERNKKALDEGLISYNEWVEINSLLMHGGADVNAVLERLNSILGDTQGTMQSWISGEKQMYDAAGNLSGAVDETTESVKAQQDALREQSEANQDFLSFVERMQSEYTSFTEKMEELRASLAELTAEQEKVPAWSQKYQDYQEQIDKTKEEIDDLAETHELASKRIAYSLLQQKLASDGLTDAEFNNLLTLGVQWGVLDQTVVDSAKLMNYNMNKMAEDMVLPLDRLKLINQKARALREVSGSEFNFTVNIQTNGAFPVVPAGGGGNTVTLTSSQTATAYAGGGHLGHGWAIVGEQGFEIVTPGGYVIPHDVSAQLLYSGAVKPDYQLYAGGWADGEVYKGSGAGIPNAPSSPVPPYIPPPPRGNNDEPDVPPVVVASEMSQAGAAVAPTIQPAAAVEAAIQMSASTQQAMAMQTQALVSSVVRTSASMVAEQRETNRLLAEQNRTIGNELAAAVIQAMP
jgi:hypothetical protein